MNHLHPTRALRPLAAAMGLAAATLLTAVATPAQAQISGGIVVQDSTPGWLYDLGAVISIFVDAPLEQPEPVAIAWAPPPMLVEDIPPPPTPDAMWTGGYWTWQGDWVWSAGRWVVPPRPRYVWVQPYYEHRDERVIFVPGYWSRPNIEFIAPAYNRPVRWAYVSANVVVGPPPSGPAGIFIPPPPGSRPGIIIPAPVGTPPAVVVSAPPVMQAGMRIRGNVNVNSHNTTVINDNRVTNYNVTNVRNVSNVIIEAPAAATANGHAFQATVPHQAHLAAAQKPVVQVRAPVPTSQAAVQAYLPGRTLATLPPPQKVQGMPAVPTHPVAAISPAQRSQWAHAPIVPPQHAPTSAAETAPKNADAGRAKAPQSPVMAATAGAEQQPLRTRQEWDRQQAQTSAQAQQHAQQQQQQKQAAQVQAQAAVQSQQTPQHAQEQAAAQQREQQQQQQQQQRAQADAQAREREQAQRQHAQADARAAQAQQNQRAQAEGQARQLQQAQREHAQADERAAQAQQQQRAQVEAQARQREQQQAQQQRMQAEQQHALQAQREAAAHAEQQRAAQRQQQHAEHAHPHGDGASHPSDGHG